MYRTITKWLILGWTILSFLVSIYEFFSLDTIEPILAIFIFFNLFLCWLAYKSMKGKRWSMILLAFFFLPGSFNIRTETITLLTKSFADFELKLNASFSLNVLTSLLFVALIAEIILASIEKKKTRTS